MRNLRKLTAAVLAVAIALTSMTAVFAVDSATIANADKAVTLKDLGLYSGQDANDPKIGLENALTTQDSLIFLAKLFGYSENAAKLTADQVAEALAKFDDAASISDYAKKVVAYSASNNILSGITKDDKFFVGAKDTVTAARFATFMLKQMGYTIGDYLQSVNKLAETKGSKVDATITGDLTRDAAVGMMYAALTAEKASGKTVIADIVGDNVDLKAKVEKLGLIEPEAKTYQDSGTKSKSSDGGGSIELRVVSVKALNTKQLEIKFNLPMDKNSAQDEINYEIKDKLDTKKTLTDNSCKLGDDMMTVTITLDSTVEDCLTNSSTGKVIVSKDIIAANGKKLGTDKEVEVEVQDGIIPTVKEVKATGEKNIKITFSEPVYEGNNTTILSNNLIAVKSETYTYLVQKAELNLNVIYLEVGTELSEGPVTVTVNDAGLQGNAIQDYAGYKAFKSEHTFNYNSNPEVIDDPESDQRCFAIAEKGKIFIIYSEAMNEAQMLDKGNYQVSIDGGDTYKDLGDNDTITKVNDRIVQIYVNELEGKNDSTLTPNVKIAPIMDIAGNRLYGSVDSYTVEGIDPENVIIKEAQLIAKDKIKVVFNKKMGSIIGSDIELTNLTTPGAIIVKECELITINSEGHTEVVLILDKELATDVTDVSGARIGITTINAPSSESEWGSKLRSQFRINLDDKTAPEIVKWNHDNDESTDDIPKVIAGEGLANPQLNGNDYTVPKDTTGIITIYFSEDINETTLTVKTFNVTGFTINSITAPAETKTVILEVIANDNNTAVKTTITQDLEINDTADNAFVPGSTWAVTLDDKPLTT